MLKSRMARIIGVTLSLACTAAVLLFMSACSTSSAKTAATTAGPNAGQRRGSQAVSVAIANAQKEDVPVYLTGLGSIAAFNTVSIRTRIDGQLVQVAFREGQEVRKGDLLAVIDPRPYQVQLSQAEATLFKDKAALRDAQINYERYQELFKDGVISKQQLDSQHASFDQLEGSVRADRAQIDNAKLNLTYTRITAPVGGRVGLRMVDVGNMVHASDQNAMLVITQLQPVAVLFTLPQDSLPSVASHMQKGTLQVEAYGRDDQTKLGTGTLLTIDNQIDPTTGTGRLKAVFDNKNNTLWPNQFVNVRLLLETRKDTTVVPAAAVQRGPQGTYAYVMKTDKTVELRPVQIAFMQGSVAAIASGLNAGDVVITDGQDKLQAGSVVEPRNVNGPVNGANRPAKAVPAA